MKAFHGDKKIKQTYLKRVHQHFLADEIIQGKYWENGKGCAVGCTIHGSEHSRYETELGIPQWLAKLEDRIFEGLPLEVAKTWPERFLKAINPGADLSRAFEPSLGYILESSLESVHIARNSFDHARFPNVLKAIDGVIHVFETEPMNREAMREARAYADADAADAADAAYAAADAAAAAADAAYAYAAYAAADAAAAYAAYAADADAAADRREARASFYERLADRLIEILEDIK